MAKKPDNQNPQQPEDNFEALEEALAEFAANPEEGAKPGELPPSDSAIDLGAGAGVGSSGNLSSVSVVEWASLVEEEAKAEAPPVKIDSPSDAEILGSAVMPQPSAATPPETIDADLEEDVIASDLAASMKTQAEEDEIDVAEEAIDLSEDAVMTDSNAADADEVIDLSGSGVDVPASGTEAAAAASDAELESGIDLMADEIVLEEPVSAGGSGRDLIAEGLESGVDLLGEGKKTAAQPRAAETAAAQSPVASEEDALDDFLATVGHDDPSSAVDLGSVHSMPTFNMDDYDPSGEHPAAAVQDEKSAEDSDPSSGIDLEGMVADEAAASPRAVKATARAAADDIDLGGADDEPAAKTKPDRVADEKPAARKTAKTDPDDDEDEKPAKKTKPERKGGGGWIGGTLLGGVLATTALLGAWTFGIDPPDALREMVGTKPPKAAPGPGPGAVGPGPGTAPVVQPPAVALSNSLKVGDLDAIKPDDLAKIDEAKPEELTSRAQARWLLYVREQRGKGMKPDAEAVKLALTDLDKAIQAGNADALFLRAEIHRRTGNVAAAKADYQEGAKKFAADAEQKERFEAALDAMNLSIVDARPAGAGVPLAMLLVFGYQAPMGDAGPKLPAEPAPKFARAVKLANEGNFAEAIKLVQEARALHDERRSVLPNKPVNPRTDPSEETFLRACDEVVKYYAYVAKLKNPNYLAADRPKDRIAVVDGLIKKGADAAVTAAVKDLGDKLVKGKAVASADDLAKLIEAERKASTDKVNDLDGKLTAAKKDTDGLMTKLKEMTAALAEKDKLLTASLDREKALKTTNDTATAALKDVGAVVNVKVEDAKATPALVKEVRELKRLEGVKDPKGEMRKLEGELVASRTKHKGEIDTLQKKLVADEKKLLAERAASEAKLEGQRDAVLAKLKNRWEPAEMLGHWLPVVEGARERDDLAKKALTDAGRVLKDPAATPAQKAQAQAIVGLVARNREDYDAAKTSLTAALPALSGEWKTAAATALKRSADPLSEIADRAQALADQGKTRAAMSLLEKGISSSSGNKAALYAQRSRIALEQARASGKVGIDDAMISAAQKDAQAAAKEGSAEGHYLAGRIAEETRQWAEAERQYREAIKVHGTLDEAGARYRAALARVLLRRSSADSTPRPVPPALRTGRLDLNGLGALLALALYAPDLPMATPSTTEAEKLADEILKQGDKVSFDVRAQALAVKGLHTRAVRTYVLGLRDKGLLAPEHANALMDLVNGHPALRRPDTRTEPDPVEGEKYYAAGLRFVAAKRWADAEREFVAAVENDGGDARYHYYLGMARVAQGNREGFEDFDRAASLERSGRPGRAAVSAALERIQGPMRAVVNAVRSRPPRERTR